VTDFIGDRKKDSGMTIKEMKKVMAENTEAANVPSPQPAAKTKAKTKARPVPTAAPRVRTPKRVPVAAREEEEEEEEENQTPVNPRLAKATAAIQNVGGVDPLEEVGPRHPVSPLTKHRTHTFCHDFRLAAPAAEPLASERPPRSPAASQLISPQWTTLMTRKRKRRRRRRGSLRWRSR